MTHLVNLKKCRGSSPGCPGLCAAPVCCVDVKKKFHEMTEDKVMLAFCIFELIEQKTFFA